MYGVILTDDEPWALTGLARIINWEDYGFKVLARCGGAGEALEFLERNGADLLFTDLRMPGMNGIDLISQVRSLSPETECVIASAYGDFEIARKALTYHVAGYILKPFSRNEVIDLVKRVKTTLDGKPGDPLSIDPGDKQSVEDALRRLDKTCRGAFHRVLLSSSPLDPDRGEKPAAGITEIKIHGNSLFSYLLSADEKEKPSITAGKTACALSKWHDTCGELSSMLFEAAAAGCGGFSYVNHPLVSSIQLYIGTHFDMDISIKSIAGLFFISPDYLCELFKKHSGDSLINFTRTVRHYNACRLLEYTDLNLKEISYRTGFNDYGYFGRSFKRFSGLTPELFRLRYKDKGINFRPDFWLNTKYGTTEGELP